MSTSRLLFVSSVGRRVGTSTGTGALLARRNLAFAASTPRCDKGSQNSQPGWEGRKGDDHALHRDGLDAQSKPSHEAREDHAKGKEGSQAISRKDESQGNKKAKEEHPEAPEPVIGMNSERGSKGY